MSILKIEPAVANTSGNIIFGNVYSTGYYFANGDPFVSSGGGGGTGTVKYTANTNPPATDNSPGDQWFNTTSQILYEYINDGNSNYWVDILSPTLSQPSTFTSMVSGNSNVVVNQNGTITLSVSGNTNVVTATGSGLTVTGNITGNLVGNVVGNSVVVSNGMYSITNYTGTFTDGIVVDYVTGTGRISVGSADGIGFYKNGVGNTPLFTVNADGNANITGALNVAGNLAVVGSITMQQSYEVVNTLTNPTGIVSYDYTTGGTYYHTSQTATWTANITNLPLVNNRILVVALIINQGATGYLPSAYQINGNNVTVKWAAGMAPTASANKLDIVALSCLYVGGGWIIIGSGGSYS